MNSPFNLTWRSPPTVLYLLLVFTISAAVWAAYLLPKTSLPLLCALVLVVGTVFGPEFFAIEGPLQVSADRVLLAGVCLFGCFQLASGRAQLPQLTASDYLVVAMVLWFLLSACTGGEPLQGINPVGTWFFYVLLPACVYALVRIHRPQRRDLQVVINVLITLGVYLAVTGVLETRGWSALVFPRFIADPTRWEFLGRARGPLLNPSANGILLSIALSFVAVRGYHGGRAAKVGYGLLGAILLVGIYATLTRSVWIGGLLSLAVIFWSYTPRWSRVLAVAGVVLLGGMAAVGLKDQLLRMKRDKGLSAAEAEKSVHLRPLLAMVALQMVSDAPLAGHGFGNYERNARPYFSNRHGDLPLEQARGYTQHNVLLSVAADTGLIGLAIYSGLLVLWISSAWRLGHAVGCDGSVAMVGLGGVGAIVAYLVGGMFQDAIVMPMIQMYLFLIAALVVTLSQHSQSAFASDLWTRRRASDAAPAVGIAVGGGAYQPAP